MRHVNGVDALGILVILAFLAVPITLFIEKLFGRKGQK